MKAWYLTNEAGQCCFEGSLEEMFRLLVLDPSDSEEPLYGPFRERCQNEGGGWEIHPKGIRTPGATYEECEED